MLAVLSGSALLTTVVSVVVVVAVGDVTPSTGVTDRQASSKADAALLF